MHANYTCLFSHFIVAFRQIDDDLTAKICMADAKFSFQEKGKVYSPQWFAPEG